MIASLFHSQISTDIFVMESSKEERPVVEAKRRRTGNLDYQNLESKVDKNLKPLSPLSLEPQNEEQINKSIKLEQVRLPGPWVPGPRSQIVKFNKTQPNLS